MIKKTARWVLRLTAFVISSFLLVALTLIVARAMAARGGPDLAWWHTQEIASEFSHKDKARPTSLEQYLADEGRVFDELFSLENSHKNDTGPHHLNRYRADSRSYPGRSGLNMNRSSLSYPEEIQGGVLLVHGMTDSPYSLRHLAAMFRDRGYYVLNLRMPGHGTIPAELDRMQWRDWQAVVELGAKHVASQVEHYQPFHVVGYSNGGSLVLKYSLDSITNAELRTPDRVFLLSPMIAVDSVARFTPLFYWLGRLEYFAQSRWLDIYPEYDPHKYNSFPVNAGLQSYRLTTTVKDQVRRMADNGQLSQMPPVMTFQSLVDKTVMTEAVIDDLYENLPVNGSELVLFDVNHMGNLDQFMLPRHEALLDRAMYEGSGRYAISVVSNRNRKTPAVAELRQAAGVRGFTSQDLQYRWPEDVYSLTHVALPFPLDDEVNGLESKHMGLSYPNLARVQMIGESGALILPPALLQRLRSNPFYGYMEQRIDAVISTKD